MKRPFKSIQPGDEFGTCPRCGRKFVPAWNETLGVFARCCATCGLRNIADSMELPAIYDDFGIQRDEHSKV